MDEAAVIRGEELAIGYRLGRRGTAVVHGGLSFTLPRGELTCLLGPNGAGKSTLLKTLSGIERPLSGQLSLNGRSSEAYSASERSRVLGVVLTDKTYAGGLRVRELVALGRHPYTGFFGQLNREDRRIVDEAMDAANVSDKAEDYVAELSDGERQKVMIAKVLAQQCPVILLDEPTAFLDVVSRIEMMNLLHRLVREEGKSVLLSTHDIDQALLLADRLWLLSKEHGMRCGTTEDLVLDGTLNCFFGRRDVAFDAASGTFRYTCRNGQRVGVEARDRCLAHWAENALLRNGFRPVYDIERGEGPMLRIQGMEEIELVWPGRDTVQCSSFGEWIRKIREYEKDEKG